MCYHISLKNPKLINILWKQTCLNQSSFSSSDTTNILLDERVFVSACGFTFTNELIEELYCMYVFFFLYVQWTLLSCTCARLFMYAIRSCWWKSCIWHLQIGRSLAINIVKNIKSLWGIYQTETTFMHWGLHLYLNDFAKNVRNPL